MANRLLTGVPLPDTDLVVPRATIGTMMFGSRADVHESKQIVDLALDYGVGFFDTANSYNDGESERILGRALKGKRRHAIVATKVGYGTDDRGREEGTSRRAILRAMDLSLERLGMDYVDVYYLHRPDAIAPIEHTLGAMIEVMQAGKARHFAISNFAAWQSEEILAICDRNGWPRPIMTQMIYNLLVRQIELEYIPFCQARNLHLTVYNPLAGGLLSGKYRTLRDARKGGRFVDNRMYRNRYWSRRMLEGATALGEIATGIGRSLTHLAISWILQRTEEASILLGPSNSMQLLDCLAAGERGIPEPTMARIDQYLRGFDGTDARYAR